MPTACPRVGHGYSGEDREHPTFLFAGNPNFKFKLQRDDNRDFEGRFLELWLKKVIIDLAGGELEEEPVEGVRVIFVRNKAYTTGAPIMNDGACVVRGLCLSKRVIDMGGHPKSPKVRRSGSAGRLAFGSSCMLQI